MRRTWAAVGIVMGLGTAAGCTEGARAGDAKTPGPGEVDGGAGDKAWDPDAGAALSFDNGGRACAGVTRSAAPDDPNPGLTLPEGIAAAPGFTVEVVASVPGARQIAALPNGDLLVATNGANVVYVPRADAPRPGEPIVFAALSAEAPVQGVAFHEPSCNVFVATQFGVYRVPYEDAQSTGQLGTAIARVREGGSQGHSTTSVAVAGKYLFAGVGSSCNACTETDPTRATVQRMNLDGSGMETYAKRIRNPIALTTNPLAGTLWAGNAGQDGLPEGHPYEFFDAVTAHPLGADYGWPDCEENNVAYARGADCAGAVAPRVVLPAYSTLVGAAFYPTSPTGAHAFPPAYRGSALVAARGAWHETAGGGYFSPPRVVAVAMSGDAPKVAVDWSNPGAQWTELVSGFETPDRKVRRGRSTGIAVGRDGSVYVGDDVNGFVYRIRPRT
jgi:glucose/arabinose dehydrogenase